MKKLLLMSGLLFNDDIIKFKYRITQFKSSNVVPAMNNYHKNKPNHLIY